MSDLLSSPSSGMGIFSTAEALIGVSERLRNAGVPSASVALLDSPSSKILAHVFTAKGSENTETVYQACSISKAITALGVARLIDRGRLTYETKIVEHLPREIWAVIVDGKTEHLMQCVTVGHLLSHRSGLSQHGYPGYAGRQTPSYGNIMAGTAPSNTPRIKFLSPPGSQSCYSGGGYLLLQILMEHITGKTFAELMSELVFVPLAMTRSSYGYLPPEEQNYAKAHVTAEVLGTDNERGYYGFTELAAAGLWTTPSDLLKAMAAIQISLFTHDGFLTRATARKMLYPTTPTNADIGSFGMGWGVNDTFFGHSGDNDPGYTTYVFGTHGLSNACHTVPQKHHSIGQMSMALMTNSCLGRDAIHKIVGLVFGMQHWQSWPSLPCGFGGMTDFVPYSAGDGVLISSDWKMFIGYWTAPRGPEYEIFEHAGLPYLQMESIEEPMKLLPGAASWRQINESRDMSVLVVDGVEMCLYMKIVKTGEKEIELVQERKIVLRPV